MQVVSGAIGRQKIHFEAPPAGRIAAEMTYFQAALLKAVEHGHTTLDQVLTKAKFWR